jgi:SagB-type dehydrogenase family enzyme
LGPSRLGRLVRDGTAPLSVNHMRREFSELSATELDATNFPEWRDRILAFEANPAPVEPRTYPGYPIWPLLRLRPRLWPPLDRLMIRRRSTATFSTEPPSKGALSRLLSFAHGICADSSRGPVPSAGGMQALELYVVAFERSWLPAGIYHFDRAGNHLSQIVSAASRPEWLPHVPSLARVKGGAVLLVLVGDYGRVRVKYGDRGLRFLLIEAGHLAQNLCLLGSTLGLGVLPLGGFFEREIGRHLALPASDEVLYLLLCGNLEQDLRNGKASAPRLRDAIEGNGARS